MTVTNSINLDEIVQWSPNMMLEISLPKKENFLQVKETLTRMGIASHKDKVLYQSCHILHKNKPSTNTELLENKEHYYYIVHFKEMFALDGRNTNISVGDIRRRNRIASLLCEWGLVDFPSYPINSLSVLVDQAPMSAIKVISFSEKSEWKLEPKYNIGKKLKYVPSRVQS